MGEHRLLNVPVFHALVAWF